MEGLSGSTDLQAAFTILAQPLLMSGLLFYSAFSMQRFRFSPILASIFIPGNNPSTKTAAGP
jgi:hypothetical protein